MSLTARRGRPLIGEATIPGDKSCSHRALILGAMAEGETRIAGLLHSLDIDATLSAVRCLGAEIRPNGSAIVVTGGKWHSPNGPIDCHNSGTTARLLIGAIAGQPGLSAQFIGDQSLSRRPMRRVTAPLERMGADVDARNHLPLTITGSKLGGISHCNLPASAQVKSAILLAGLGTDWPVEVIEPVPSRDHSEIMLRQFGVDVDIAEVPHGRRTRLGERRILTGTTISIATDPSSAAFPLVAAALVPGSAVTIRAMNANPLRMGLYEALGGMGADIGLGDERTLSGERVADLTVRASALRPCHIDAGGISAMIDEIPALAVACAFADGESVIEGLSELRHKESDRIGALVAGLAACGVAATIDEDRLTISGRGAGSVRGGARVASHGDHRIAMAFLTLGLAARERVEVDSKGIGTSFPGYVSAMRALGADIG